MSAVKKKKRIETIIAPAPVAPICSDGTGGSGSYIVFWIFHGDIIVFAYSVLVYVEENSKKLLQFVIF
jgi:hypothetical protein